MKDVYLIILVATATLFSLTTADDNVDNGAPEGKLISTFQIVRFPNDVCVSTSLTRNGTCYTSAECSDKGGASQGSCADGFGVCCIFVINSCGQSSSENVTYWDAPGTIATGECNLTINPVNANICQLRLDFLSFVITGPSTSVQTAAMMFAGLIPGGVLAAAASGVGAPNGIGTADVNEVNWSTNCLTDSFSISSANPANKPPVVCGTLSAQHMYVDMDSDHSNTLSFIFNSVAGPAAAAVNNRGIAALGTRDWDITILQYECGYINQAPTGCTQYFWADTGATVGQFITNYNFGATVGVKHLAHQNQKICIRREKNICWATFYLNAAGTYSISGRTNALALLVDAFTAAGQPCGYAGEVFDGQNGAAGGIMVNYDCIIIPGAFAIAAAATGVPFAIADDAVQVRQPLVAANNHSPFPPQNAGHGILGAHVALDATALQTGDLATAYTVFTQHEPFTLIFKSDGVEGQGGNSEGVVAASSVGFKLSYDLISCVA